MLRLCVGRRDAARGRTMSNARVRVRPAGPGDEPVLRRLRLEALADAPEAFTSTIAREAARTDAEWQRWLTPGITLFLEDDDGARGVVAGVRDAGDDRIVYLMAMWVDPALRGSGAADALMSAHLAWARTAGARLVRLHVIETNARARRLYERHGFRVTGRGPRTPDGRRELRMERYVDEATGAPASAAEGVRDASGPGAERV